MGLKNAPVDSKGIIALLSTPFAFVPVGIGATQLPTDEQAIVASVASLAALVGPLVPAGTSGTGVTVPTSLNNLWLAPTTGLDTNDGLTSLTPVKTMAKINAILGPSPGFGADFTLHVTEALAESFVLDWGLGAPNIEVEVLGTETLFGAVHTLTAVQNRVKATNTRQTMTEGATNWATSLGKIARITTVAGGRFNSKSICLLNPGAGVCTMATWLLTTEATITNAPTETPPIIGDTVEVVDSLAVSGDFTIHVSGLINSGAKFFMRGFRFTGSSASAVLVDKALCYIVDCVVNTPLSMANVQMINCFEDAAGVYITQPSAGSATWYGGAGSATVIDGGANVTINLGFVQLGLGLIVSDAGTFVSTDDMAVYDWTAAPGAITVRRGANFVVTAAAAVWGTSATANTPVLVVTEDSVVQNLSGTTFLLAIPALGQTVPSTMVRGVALAYPTDGLVPSALPRLVCSFTLTGTGGGGTLANVSPAGSGVVIAARNGAGDYQITTPSIAAANASVATGVQSAADDTTTMVHTSATSKRVLQRTIGVLADGVIGDYQIWATS